MTLSVAKEGFRCSQGEKRDLIKEGGWHLPGCPCAKNPRTRLAQTTLLSEQKMQLSPRWFEGVEKASKTESGGRKGTLHIRGSESVKVRDQHIRVEHPAKTLKRGVRIY